MTFQSTQFRYIDPDQRRIAKEIAYHSACMEQYRASVSVLRNAKMIQRCLDNAKYHEDKLASLTPLVKEQA
jgi:hypothetical protein